MPTKMTARNFLTPIALFVLLLFPVLANAQCAMCRAALESEGDVSRGEAMNNGIVYLMAVPYILVAVVSYYVYRTRFAKKN